MRRPLLTLLLLPLAVCVVAQIPPRSVSTPKEEVDDEFLAYIHGLIVHDALLRIDGETLRRTFPEFVPDRPTPFNDILMFTRLPDGGRPRLTIRFSVPLEYEVPVDIFGHRPVRLFGSALMSFEETRPLADPGSAGPAAGATAAEVSSLYVLSLVSGYMRVDFAPWLDFVAGALLEDVDVTLIAVARYRERWYALLGGFSPDLRAMIGVLDMKTTRFMVRPPRALTALARSLVEQGP